MRLPELKIIGVVHGDIHNTADAPKFYSESSREGILEIRPEYLEAIDGVQPGQTIVVLFWLDRASRNVLKVHPRGDTSRPVRGVFSTRSPHRPNPIALSELEVLEVNDNEIKVRGLDILDGTPILDIKMQK